MADNLASIRTRDWNEEHSQNVATIKEADESITALTQAIETLSEFYSGGGDKASFL